MKGAHLPFNFQLIFAAWNAGEVARIVAEYEAAMPKGGSPNWVLGNHDQKRIATRVGAAEARVAAMLLFTLRGTPTIYYGDELGLEDVLDSARTGTGPLGTERTWTWTGTRPGTHADALGQLPPCRLHNRGSLAPAEPRLCLRAMWRRRRRIPGRCWHSIAR